MIERQLQFFFVAMSLFTFVFVLNKIRKHKLNINDSIIWILWSLFLLVLSIFPRVPLKIAAFLGFQSTSNFILCLFVFFVFIIVFYQEIQISLLKERNKELVQKCSIYAYKNEGKKE